MSMKNVLKVYEDTVKKITEHFGVEYFVAPELNTKYYWSIDGDNLSFWEDKPKDVDNTQFGYEIKWNFVKVRDDYTLVYVDNGCGESFYTIWDNTKKVSSSNEG